MKVEKPIFIIGVGRSGSTAFHRMFAKHPHVAWLSELCSKYPENPSINRLLMKVIDYPIVGRYLKRKFDPRECYEFWEYYCKGFSEPCRDLLAEDVTNKNRFNIQKAMSEVLCTKKNRLLIKITGWPRIGFLHEIFSDAKFINVIRDGRAVANSIINVNWWSGWKGPENWGMGELTQAQKKEWERHDKSFVALAGILWKIMVEAMENAKQFIDMNNYMEFKFEDLCSNSVEMFRNVMGFCDLEWTRDFENQIKKFPFKITNDKWQKELTIKQHKMIEDVIGDYLRKYNYL
jgi:hypothetical protein